MKIGLVDATKDTNDPLNTYCLPMGLLSLAAIAEELGHNIELIELDRFLPAKQQTQDLPSYWGQLLSEKTFDVIGFTTRIDLLPLVLETARQYKLRCKNVPVIFGGPGISFVSKEAIEAFPFIDIIVRGEGEMTFKDLLNAMEKGSDLKEVDGITSRDNDEKARQTPDRPSIKDLSLLPKTPYHLVENMLRLPFVTKTTVLVGRGCPNNCTFCSTKAFWGNHVRMRPVEVVVEEMKHFSRDFGINEFSITHDNLLCNKSWIRSFCDLLKKERLNINFSISGSLNFFDPELFKIMKEVGGRAIFIGIESISDRAKKNMMKKSTSRKDIEEKLNIIRRMGYDIVKSYILGWPEETTEEIDQTINFAIGQQAKGENFPAERTQLHVLTLTHGTELYDKYKSVLVSSEVPTEFTDTRVMESESCRKICKDFPTITTAYAAGCKASDYSRLHLLAKFYNHLVSPFSKSIYVALRQLGLSPVQFFEKFRVQAVKQGLDLENLASKQSKVKQLQNFSAILERIYEDARIPQYFIRLMLDYEAPLVKVCCDRTFYRNLFPEQVLADDFLSELSLIIPGSTFTLQLPYDPEKCFKEYVRTNKAKLPWPLYSKKWIYYLPRQNANDTKWAVFNRIEMKSVEWRLSMSILRNVNGKNSFKEVANETIKDLGLEHKWKYVYAEITNQVKKLVHLGILMAVEEL